MTPELQIRIEDLAVMACLGVTAEERGIRQKVLVTVSFQIPIPLEDHLAATVDYAAVADLLQQHAESAEWQLLERMAVDLATQIKVRLELREVWIRLKKFVLPDTAWVSVEYRTRE